MHVDGDIDGSPSSPSKRRREPDGDTSPRDQSFDDMRTVYSHSSSPTHERGNPKTNNINLNYNNDCAQHIGLGAADGFYSDGAVRDRFHAFGGNIRYIMGEVRQLYVKLQERGYILERLTLEAFSKLTDIDREGDELSKHRIFIGHANSPERLYVAGLEPISAQVGEKISQNIKTVDYQELKATVSRGVKVHIVAGL